MRRFTHSISLMGKVVNIDVENACFTIRCHSGDEFHAFVSKETQYKTLTNLDNLNRDRYDNPPGYDSSNPSKQVEKYIRLGHLVSLYGVYQETDDNARYDVNTVNLLQEPDGQYFFEATHWWLTQISCMADVWLNDLFGPRAVYDFTRYRTYIGITGIPVENCDIQECSTLSRLIYGLSSAYLLTGCERYLEAAGKGVIFQREHFRNLTHDGRNVFWAYGKDSDNVILPSRNSDDNNTIPLYEQIYALAGLTQYYRITLDWETFEDIQKTVASFNKFFIDDSEEGGYFSHIDYATMSWDTPALGDNCAKKNWNSIGDHIPAYLINVILSLDPLPKSRNFEEFNRTLKTLKTILKDTSSLIVEKFPDPKVPFVCERFLRDWTPDLTYRWQQNRAIVGHNLKIAWNLTRVASYLDEDAEEMMKIAEKLSTTMVDAGTDQIRGGIFDAVEREPSDGRAIQFAWGNTKDFWQQEQAILAYLIVYGYTGKEEYLQLAREMMAFWNLHYLDRDRGGVYFRVNDDGKPDIQGGNANKGGHAISGYHVFELNFLAHIYISAFVSKKAFCMNFRPSKDCGQSSINVLPDFFRKDTLYVKRITVNGQDRTTVDPDNFQIELSEKELGSEIIVELAPKV